MRGPSRRLVLAGLGAALPALALNAPVRAERPWQTIVEPTFGTALDVPRDVFPVEEPPPHDFTGLAFLTDGGGGRLVLRAQPNASNLSPEKFADFLSNSLSYEALTYRAGRGAWRVLSGYASGRIFYLKFLFSRDYSTIHQFRVDYVEDLRGVFDEILPRMQRSLRILAPGEAGG